jgi:hypothetical protein
LTRSNPFTSGPKIILIITRLVPMCRTIRLHKISNKVSWTCPLAVVSRQLQLWHRPGLDEKLEARKLARTRSLVARLGSAH